GIVYLTLLIDKRTRKLTRYPVITAHGILFRRGSDPGKIVEQAEDLGKRKYPDFADLKDWDEALKNEVRRFFAKAASHRPLVVSTRLEI
ncbi:hypothetical protein, partial [Staphylococcus pseudintermedius]|uniref:hypothetical protein n=1 Tax=Staphylococcus pseudintermedius TaxID=283734 RepID=UPI0013002E2F